MKTQVLGAEVSFLDRELAAPLVLSTGTVSETTEARVEVRVKVDGREGIGRGAIYLSDLWAWPDPLLTHEERDEALRNLCREIAENLIEWSGREAAHPLELGMRLHEAVCLGEEKKEMPSVLAQAMCASPFDAAIHDATGLALGIPAFAFYDRDAEFPSVDRFFADGDACGAIRRLIQKPVRELDAWWIVGKGDSLDEVVAQVHRREYRCFKLKIMGRDSAEDAERTVEVFRALREGGVEKPRLTVDSNEGNVDADSVLEFLERLQSKDAEAFDALDYLEQPTGRDISVHKFDWSRVTALKPVLLDEGLTSLELLEEAVTQGWSGLALKTCKGHSFALVAAAWARERGLLLALQDLTNPGYALIHGALFAAHVPMINGVELNSPQFTPEANAEWLPRLNGLFEPAGGMHRLSDEIPPGLGSGL